MNFDEEVCERVSEAEKENIFVFKLFFEMSLDKEHCAREKKRKIIKYINFFVCF